MQAATRDKEQAVFTLCSGSKRTTCVVDGDTIWYRGEKIRLVGFDTPEIHHAACPRERELGEEAKLRLREWLNAGAFSLEPNPDGRPRDRYGRSLLVLSRGGENVGQMFIADGLAEKRGGSENIWC
ncbi:MAG: thermonuclease family protein [Erythrobacter sp.]|nr:thermonuclease family protein [Erythrobacter sp.]